MTEDTQKMIEDQFASLPLAVRESISRVPWQARARDIGKREGFDADKAEVLETETMLILYGFEPAENFISNLMSQLSIEEEQAERISGLIGKEIVDDIEKQYEMIEALNPEVAGAAAPKPVEPHHAEPEKEEVLNIPPEILAKQIKMPSEPVKKLPEVAPNMLPETLPGETAHNVPHVETSAPQPIATPATPVTPAPEPKPIEPAPTPAPAPEPSAPKSIVEEKLSGVTVAESQAKPVSYPQGADPYREPIE